LIEPIYPRALSIAALFLVLDTILVKVGVAIKDKPSDFQKEEYLGRLTYFNIILQKNLTSE